MRISTISKSTSPPCFSGASDSDGWAIRRIATVSTASAATASPRLSSARVVQPSSGTIVITCARAASITPASAGVSSSPVAPVALSAGSMRLMIRVPAAPLTAQTTATQRQLALSMSTAARIGITR